ncbi:helix-turn-helix transcriptional regulator [Rhodococcus aerolatus]
MATPAAPVNATAAALLGLLHDGPATGGELIATAHLRHGGYFGLTRSQVYRELPALADAGLLRLGKQGARASQQYVITAAGKKAFRTWVASGAGEVDAVRSPLALRLVHADHLTATQRADLVEHARAAVAERVVTARRAVPAAETPAQKAAAEFALAHVRALAKLVDTVSKL